MLRVNGQGSHRLSVVQGWWCLSTLKDGCLFREGARRKCLAHIVSSPKLLVQAAGRGEVGRMLNARAHRAQADTQQTSATFLWQKLLYWMFCVALEIIQPWAHRYRSWSFIHHPFKYPTWCTLCWVPPNKNRAYNQVGMQSVFVEWIYMHQSLCWAIQIV